jgi:hypothetical protein
MFCARSSKVIHAQAHIDHSSLQSLTKGFPENALLLGIETN